MKPHRPVYVVGGAHSRYLSKAHPAFISRKHPDFPQTRNPGLEEHLHSAIRSAFDETGVSAEQIDKGYIGNFLGELFCKQGHLGAMAVAAHEGLRGKPFARMEAACASGGVSMAAAIDAIQAGYEVLLVAGAEVETNVRGRDGVEYMARAAHYQRERGLSQFTFPHLFARRAYAYKQAFGHSDEATGRVVAKAYANANANPLAAMHTVEVTLEEATEHSVRNAEFLENKRYRPHLRLLDCTEFADGASAIILASAAGLERLGLSTDQCTEILSYGHTVQALGDTVDPTQMSNVAHAAAIAYAHADRSARDVDVAEVHDCFSISELQIIEALRFCSFGEAPRLMADGVTARTGRLPVNPGGGLLGFGHPVGATGVRQVLEIWRQMKGRCGDYQLKTRPQTGITANIGGDDRTAVVMLHHNCG